MSVAPSAYIIYACFSWIFFPFVVVLLWFRSLLRRAFKYDARLAFLLEKEKESLIKASQTSSSSLNREEQAMVHSIFELKKTTVDEIMVPRVNVEGLEVHASLQTTLDMIKTKGHSRIPVYTETIDSIDGILYAKDLISFLAKKPTEPWNLLNCIKKPLFVPLSKKIDDLMREFKRRHLHIAVVVDEYGGTAGLVTMENILEEIVGEINDEYDVETRAVNKVTETVFLVDPQISLTDLSETLHIPLQAQEGQFNTLGGLIYHQVGAIPSVNTEFEFQGLRIKVIAMDNQRIEKTEIEVLKNPGAASETETPF
jgi:CBS domain containing-hemolysin-like protein